MVADELAAPPAEGERMHWEQLPARVRREVEHLLAAPVVRADTQPGGFSPGVAARVLLADGRRAFVKSAGPVPNPHTPAMHRREGAVTAVLPPGLPVPRLLGRLDDGDRVTLVFEDVPGSHPTVPWRSGELADVLRAIARLHEGLTPNPAPHLEPVGRLYADVLTGWRSLASSERTPPGLDAWSARHLQRLAELEAGWPAAAAGPTLLHTDLRGDNILVGPGGVTVVDWPSACQGAAFVDLVVMLPSVVMQGGPPPQTVLRGAGPMYDADPAAVDAVLAAVAGYFTCNALRPPPPGLPTVRAFQAAQGRPARAWLAERTGLR